ncbi:hypothetical protein ACQSSU_03195 [Micromonospora echinospora]
MTWQGWRVLVACLLAALGAAAVSIVYTIDQGQQAERRLCDLVTAQDDAYREAPPQTAAGRRVADAVAQLRADFDCPA